jgi:putative ABC transport system permease protein
MSIWIALAWRSAWSRRGALLLVLLSIMVSSALVLSVQQLRQDAQRSFSQALTGVDLIVGPRGSPAELMLYAVFHMGRATRNMSYEALAPLSELPQVRFVVPLQLGDSYRGAAVVGTTPEFFSHIQTAEQPLRFQSGVAFSGPDQVVLGADLARSGAHRLGDAVVLTHGQEGPLAQTHDHHPFTVTGLLAPTGTPIDRSVFISLAGFEAMHQEGSADPATALTPLSVTAVLVGLKQKALVFSARRSIESLPRMGLMAVLPGVTLDELWRMLSVAENALLVVGIMVAISTMFGVTALLLVSLAGRRRELAILRALGASPMGLFTMLLLESLLISLIGLLAGWLLLQLEILLLASPLREQMGIILRNQLPSSESWMVMSLLLGCGLLAGLIPAWRAYRLTLSDGLNPPSLS